MLYVNFSSDGRYFNDDYVEGASSPVIQKKDGSTMAFANGAHDCGLEIKIDLDADICEVRLAKSDNKTVYILGQESTYPGRPTALMVASVVRFISIVSAKRMS